MGKTVRARRLVPQSSLGGERVGGWSWGWPPPARRGSRATTRLAARGSRRARTGLPI